MASPGERALAQRGIEYSVHEYDYRKKGAAAASVALGVPVEAVAKTLVVRLEDGRHVLLLAGGGAAVSLRGFARALGAGGAELAMERDAERLTGFRVGGIGPFGTRTPLAVHADLSLLSVERVYVNGGRRGRLLGLSPEDLVEATGAGLVDVARP